MTNNLNAIRIAFDAGGVEFLPENGGGPGVRLRKEQKPLGPVTVTVRRARS
jgi:hypothetical protein